MGRRAFAAHRRAGGRGERTAQGAAGRRGRDPELYLVPPEGAAGRGEAGEGLRSIGPDDAERPHAGPVVYQHLRQNTARGSHLAAAATALIQSSLFFEEGA